MTIDGTGTPGISFSLESIIESDCACTSLDSGPQTITANASTGVIPFTIIPMGNFTIQKATLKINLFLNFGAMTQGQTVVLPSSATVLFGNVSGAPEPAAISLMLAGFGGLGLLLYKRRS